MCKPTRVVFCTFSRQKKKDGVEPCSEGRRLFMSFCSFAKDARRLAGWPCWRREGVAKEAGSAVLAGWMTSSDEAWAAKTTTLGNECSCRPCPGFIVWLTAGRELIAGKATSGRRSPGQTCRLTGSIQMQEVDPSFTVPTARDLGCGGQSGAQSGCGSRGRGRALARAAGVCRG